MTLVWLMVWLMVLLLLLLLRMMILMLVLRAVAPVVIQKLTVVQCHHYPTSHSAAAVAAFLRIASVAAVEADKEFLRPLPPPKTMQRTIGGAYSADSYLSLPSSSSSLLSLYHLPHCPQRTEGDYS
jgi:hypothetical protein